MIEERVLNHDDIEIKIPADIPNEKINQIKENNEFWEEVGEIMYYFGHDTGTAFNHILANWGFSSSE